MELTHGWRRCCRVKRQSASLGIVLSSAWNSEKMQWYESRWIQQGETYFLCRNCTVGQLRVPLGGWINAEIRSLGVHIFLCAGMGIVCPKWLGFFPQQSNSSIIFKALAAFAVLNMPKKELLFKKPYRLRKGENKNVCFIRVWF